MLISVYRPLSVFDPMRLSLGYCKIPGKRGLYSPELEGPRIPGTERC